MCDPATAILGSGIVGGLGSLVGGGLSAGAASSAAQAQSAAALQAAQLQSSAEQQALAFQQQQYQTTQANLAPYMQLGQQGLAALQGATPDLINQVQSAVSPLYNPITSALTGPPPSNLALLQQTPGYQFTLQQGLESVQNSFAGQGLASSGAAMKGAANYAENLASTTYQQQFQNWLNQNQLLTSVQQATNQQQQTQSQLELQKPQLAYNMLAGLTQTGAQAALGQGQIGTQLTGQTTQAVQAGATGIGQGITGSAAAQAAGTVGATNAITNALGGISGAGSNTALLLALNQAGMFAPPAPAAGNTQSTGLPF
jgi:hypothetical protein